LTISLFFFLSIRVCFSSIMPAWSGTIANLVHFLIGLVIIIDQFGLSKRLNDETIVGLLFNPFLR
jgi:hypothetical protein